MSDFYLAPISAENSTMIRRKCFSLSDFKGVSTPDFKNRFSESNAFLNVAFTADDGCAYSIFLRIPRDLPLSFRGLPFLPFCALNDEASLPLPQKCLGPFHFWNWSFKGDHCFNERFTDSVRIFLTGKAYLPFEEKLVFEITEPKDATHFLYLIDFDSKIPKEYVDGAFPLLFKFLYTYGFETEGSSCYCLLTGADQALEIVPDMLASKPLLSKNSFDFQAIYETILERENKIYREEEERKEKCKAFQIEEAKKKSAEISRRTRENIKIFNSAKQTLPALLNKIITQNREVISELETYGVKNLELFPNRNVFEVVVILRFVDFQQYAICSANSSPEKIIEKASITINSFLKTLRQNKLIKDTLDFLSTEPPAP